MKELLPITIAVFVKYTQIYVIQWKKGLSSHMSENTNKKKQRTASTSVAGTCVFQKKS